jgi:hypothetical protein
MMLGFSPLAADSGQEASIIYLLTGVDITTGQPTVGTSTLSETSVINLVDITTGQPTVSSSAITQDHLLTSVSILTGQPVVPSINMAEDETLLART